MRISAFIALFIIASNVLVAQIECSIDSVQFPQRIIKTTDSATVYLHNKSNSIVTVMSMIRQSCYSVSPQQFTINPTDSVPVKVYFTPKENISYNDILVFLTADSIHAFAVLLRGSGKYNDMYDATTFDKFDTELKSALTSMVSGHTSLGYNIARDSMFVKIDKQPGDTIECVYTGRKIQAANRTIAQNQGFNTEHTWPQSTFNEAEPMRSDINHLFPTDETANTIRSNYPFGTVVSNITWQVGGSKKGNGINGNIVFEPRDVHKGDCARAMLYFILRYPSNYGGYLDTAQVNVYRMWNAFDTVSLKEINRNNKIGSIQGKRNPLIDHPEFVERIYSFTTSAVRPPISVPAIAPLKISFDSVATGSIKSQVIYLYNSGNKSYTINTISSPPDVTVQGNGIIVPPYSIVKFLVEFSPTLPGTLEGNITFSTTEGVITLPVSGTAYSVSSTEEIQMPGETELFDNYPNPFNPATKISFYISEKAFTTLVIHDVLGKIVAVLFNDELEQGLHNIEFNANGLPSGIYFSTLVSGKFRTTKKLLLLR